MRSFIVCPVCLQISVEKALNNVTMSYLPEPSGAEQQYSYRPITKGKKVLIYLSEDKCFPKYYFPNSKVIIKNYDIVKDGAKPSAFKAVNTTSDQAMVADNPVNPVLYPDVIFDVKNEYDPVTSTFTPKQDGVYSIIASVNFLPDISQQNYRVLIEIYVNGIAVASDNDFFGEILIGDVTAVSAILQLKAGAKVNVSALASTDGIVNANPVATRFEGARFPSPLVNCYSNSITVHPNQINIKEI